jgi:hypothetical protein
LTVLGWDGGETGDGKCDGDCDGKEQQQIPFGDDNQKDK